MPPTKSKTQPSDSNSGSRLDQDAAERRKRIASIAYSLAARRGFAGDSDDAFEDWSEAVRIVDEPAETDASDAKPDSKVLTRAMRRLAHPD